MRPICSIAAALVLAIFGGSAQAADLLQCAKAQCEATSRSCVEAHYSKYEACVIAGRKKCDSVSPAQKIACLRDETRPCVSTRNAERNACVTQARSCFASCGPNDGKQVYYWCEADLGKKHSSTFCLANPANPNNVDHCAKEFVAEAGPDASMTCESL
jgi:hypothetical protein